MMEAQPLLYTIIFCIAFADLVVTNCGISIDTYSRQQKRVHQVRHQQMLAAQQQHHHKSESHDEEDAEKVISPGDPLGPKHSLEYGANCVKTNPQACKYFPEVTCVWVEENDFVCRCDFQHTWNHDSKLCIANVFAPCLDTEGEMDCGLNMECRPDIIGSNPKEKMCRCKKGFKILTDAEGLPSECILDANFSATEEVTYKTVMFNQQAPAIIVSQNLCVQIMVTALNQVLL